MLTGTSNSYVCSEKLKEWEMMEIEVVNKDTDQGEADKIN